MGLWDWLHRIFGNDNPSRPSSLHHDVEDVAIELASRCWKIKPGLAGQFFLDSNQTRMLDHETFLHLILEHVRKFCGKIENPRFRPQILAANIGNAAGKYIEQDGWVTIVLNSRHFFDRRAAQSIICHEACHYILEFNGIRKNIEIENEVMVDVAMFVFGLDDVFLAGHRVEQSSMNMDGVRFGYLEPVDYRSLRIVISNEINKSKYYSTDDSGNLYKRLRVRLLGDDVKIQRYMSHMDQKHPSWSRSQKIEEILRQLER